MLNTIVFRNGKCVDVLEDTLTDVRVLASALQDLHDACEFWEDQQDPVLANARKALRQAGYEIAE